MYHTITTRALIKALRSLPPDILFYVGLDEDGYPSISLDEDLSHTPTFSEFFTICENSDLSTETVYAMQKDQIRLYWKESDMAICETCEDYAWLCTCNS